MFISGDDDKRILRGGLVYISLFADFVSNLYSKNRLVTCIVICSARMADWSYVV